jgi:hypothetical protein
MSHESAKPFFSPKPPDPNKFTKHLEGSYEVFRAVEDDVHQAELKIRIAEFTQEIEAVQAATAIAFNINSSSYFESMIKEISNHAHKRALCFTYCKKISQDFDDFIEH